MTHRSSYLPYVLITPAHNEEAFIEKTIQSMTRQTLLPTKWVIVNDGSTDSTANIVERYLAKHEWIEMIQRPQRRDRNFAAKVYSFNAGYERVKSLEYEVIGNLDADVSFGDEDYCEFLLRKFKEDSNLGVAGTIFKEEGYSSEAHSFEGDHHVAGGCQLFRRREKDYYLGGHPVWELFRVAYRMTKRPYLIEGIALALGYCWALLRQIERPISHKLMEFHRREQMLKLKIILKSILKFKRVDSFKVIPN